MLGSAGLLGMPYPEDVGGGGVPYEVYLQVLEEIGAVWSAIGVGISVHALSCFGLATAGTEDQQQRWLPEMLSGELLGAYCLSEPHAGSDPAAMRTVAMRDGDKYVIEGTKAWITHGGHADFYNVMARTGGGTSGISCFLVPADAVGLTTDSPERKMGLTGSSTTGVRFEQVRVSAERRLGDEGDGLKIALAGLDSGRLGREASIAKLVATDNAMRVTTDAVQVLGAFGYTRDFPVERFMREAKAMQIFEGTNQVQRLVIGRSLDRDTAASISCGS